MIQKLLEFDQLVFNWINAGLRNPVLDWLMPVVSNWQYFWLPLLLVLAIILIRGGSRSRWILLGLIMVLALGDSFTSLVLKPFFDRPRPYITLNDIMVFKDHWVPSSAIRAHKTISFPSTHAVNATAAATLLIFYFRKWWPIPVVFVILVGFSRVYMGLHYPSDVLAGMVVGLACAGVILLLQTLFRKLFPKYLNNVKEEART